MGCITRQQFDELEALADDVGADKVRLCQFLNVESLRDLPMRRFSDAKQAIERKRGAK